MTVEEIKDRISVEEMLNRFDVQVNRHKMAHCPFHGEDAHPSMKVYAKSVHCFTCGFDGDIFDIYMRFEQCDFKTAYKALGGAYENHTANYSAELMRNKWEREKAEKQDKILAEKAFYKKLRFTMEMCEHADNLFEVFSDEWCDLINARDWLNYCYERKYIEGKEINTIDVLRKCERLRRRVYPS